MLSTWTIWGGQRRFDAHARLLRRVRPFAEPVLGMLMTMHAIQGAITIKNTPIPLLKNERWVSACILVLFLGYHIESLRMKQHQSLFESTVCEVMERWPLFEVGLLALAIHTKSPCLACGFVVPLLVQKEKV